MATKKSRTRSIRMVPGTAASVGAMLETLEDLAVVDLRRLQKLLPLLCDGQVEREACARALFADDDVALRSFTSRVNRKAAGLLELAALKAPDGRPLLEVRIKDETEERIARHAAASSDLPAVLVDNPAVPGDRDGKPALYFTVLRARGDARPAAQLIEALHTNLRSSRKFAHDLWDQSKVLTGDDPQEEIEAAIRRSDYVIVLLSPKLLDDQSLRGALQAAGAQRYIPVALGLLDERHELGVFHSLEPFRHEDRAWSQCTTAGQREAFVIGLFVAIERVVERALAGEDVLQRRLREHAEEHARLPVGILDSEVAPANLGAPDAFAVASGARGQVKPQSGREMLLEWVDRPDAPHYACVLGEFGIGKTTLLKRFTLALLARRAAGREAPLPIFLDLKTYMNSIEGARERSAAAELPQLELFLRELLVGTWKHAGPPPAPAQVLRMVREEGAVVIVDGLDEKLVHLSEAQGTALIRMLWGILPPALFRKPAPGKRPGRVVMSCRSHVFATLQKQNSTFTGGHRDDVRPEDYLALVVLPFSEAKIREYLGHHVSGRVDEVMALIASVHNLTDLAPRPLFLGMIREQIGRLEEIAARGEPVRGVSLYDHMVEACIDRDEGKHTIRPEDKPLFMEAIAAAMWRDGAREWPWSRVFKWLREHIVGDRVLRKAYPLHGARTAPIAEDFRTATMMLRPDQGNMFRFAHTSLQEYFLARWLYRALIEGRPDDWRVRIPSDETLDFLGQLIVVRGGDKWRAGLDGLLAQHRPQASLIALRYWMLACKHGHPQPEPAQVCLPGEMLQGWTIAGTAEAPLMLAGADLRGANLRHAVLLRVDLQGADLRGADVVCTTLEDVNLRAAQLADADFTGSVWRDSSVEGAIGEAASWWDSEWIRTTPVLGVRREDASRLPPPEVFAEARRGHKGLVNACAYSPDGTSIVSASNDNSLKVWDARSGRAILSLSGHTDTVNACAYSPDGATIISASNDNTLKGWNVRSGRAIFTLSGHKGPVNACAYSPDGVTIVSASDDKTLKIWDVRRGRALLTLKGHMYWVRACAFSPDGETIVSASYDKTIKVWDALSGRVLLTLVGHTNWVNGCAYSPDGSTIVSASDDGTLRVWNTRSGQALLLLLAGTSSSVKACAYNPDGETVASASVDGTLKVWDARSGRALLTTVGHSPPMKACAYSPDGSTLVSASVDGTLTIWSAQNGRSLLTLADHSKPVNACAYGPGGATFVSASEDGTLKVWDARSGRELRALIGHSQTVKACVYSPNGATIVSSSNDHTLKVWSVRNGRNILNLAGHSREVNACAYSPNGATIVSASDDNTVKVWDARTGQALFTLAGHGSWVKSCVYSPNGANIVSASIDKTLVIWDAVSGRALLTLSGHSSAVKSCAYSPDGTAIASASDDNTLKVWDAQSGRNILTLTGHLSSVNACAYSPNGATLVSASTDETMKVWDANSGRIILTLTGHSSAVRACAYSPDGRTIVSASMDGSAKVWEATTGRLLRTYWHLEGAAATIDETTNRVLWATANAWRYLCYRGFDPERGAYRVYPIEAFGPLPT